MKRNVLTVLIVVFNAGPFIALATGQAIGAARTTPNLESQIDSPLRYRPDGADFVIENGPEFFNRPLYGGNTAFRVDAGDRPEFTMYLPGRGGNLRLGMKRSESKWLHAAQSITARYRPGGMIYEIRDPLLGPNGSLHLEVYALAATEGLIVRAEGQNTPADLELLWAYGGVNGQRGARDGDIGTERVPISEYFQLRPDFCRGNSFETTAGAFTLKSTPATIFGRVGGDGDPKPEIADAHQWADPAGLFATVGAALADSQVIVGRIPLGAAQPRFISLQCIGNQSGGDLTTYQQVTASRPAETIASTKLLAPLTPPDQARLFADTTEHFKRLRGRVTVETPDPYINASVGALNVAGDAVWDAPQQAIMHGSIAWRTKLLGWRGPYVLDALGWHDRARTNIEYWMTRQNTTPIPTTLPGPDENSNLARSEAALHQNGDMSNSHYDMNMVFIDAMFRHILWTGDRDFAAKIWPTIERHLAWEQRSFRRPYGPEKLPLYEAYAVIWASDDLYYNGGGSTHSSAYNYYHNKMAARVARLIGKDPVPYEREADLIHRAMRDYLWLADKGWYAEYRDLLGHQLAHPSAALWTIYHTTDAGATSPIEAWQLTRYVDQMNRIPVRGPGVPAAPSADGYAVVPTSNWMPYSWSINNVCMNENAHMALSYWQAGRSREAHLLLKSSLLASMYMGIAPGNIGTMTYLDVYRRESQRDFADGAGTLSRAVVEGLFGVLPDALAGELHIRPGFPATWDHAAFRHPDVAYSWKRTGQSDTFTIESQFGKPMALRLTWPALSNEVASVTVNGAPGKWEQDTQAIGRPRLVITASPAAKWEITIQWKGGPIAEPPSAIQASIGQAIKIALPATVKTQSPDTKPVDPQKVLASSASTPAGYDAHIAANPGTHTLFIPVQQGMFSWVMPVDVIVAAPAVASTPVIDWSKPATPAASYETVELTKFFNQRVTEIFKQEYRSPRSPYVSLAIPKQGIGAWAGHVNATASIDDSGLRQVAANGDGKLVMPNGVPLRTPSATDAPNIAFTSLWDNFPREVTIPLNGKATRVYLLMAGSTNFMQSRFDNGEVVVAYSDGTTARLVLNNPVNWWPIDQDYFIDDYQFRRPDAIPPRVDLKTGSVRLLDPIAFKGRGRTVDGGAANVLDLALDPARELQSLTVRTIANDVVIGLMSLTVQRPQ